jgi:phage terminase large subunit-like protein
VNIEHWLKCGADAPDPIAWRAEMLERYAGRVCEVGLDLGSVSDLTAFVLLFRESREDEIYTVIPFFWIPEQNAIKKETDHAVPYTLWCREKFITTTNRELVATDYEDVKHDILELRQRYRFARSVDGNKEEIAADTQFQGMQIMSDLKQNHAFEPISFGNSYVNYNPPCRRFLDLIADGKIRHGNNPVMNWMIGNLEVLEGKYGDIRPIKPRNDAAAKVDGAVAMLMALGRAMVREVHRESVYEQREPFVV